MIDLPLSEEHYREMFHLSSDAIWVHDLKGNIIIGNEAFEKMIGHTMDKLLGKNVKGFLSESALSLASVVKRKLLEGKSISGRYEQRLLRGNGSNAIVEITTCLIRNNVQPVAFQNIARDITDERAIQDNLKFYLRKILVVQEEERKRIARDLHDDTMQSLLLFHHGIDAIICQFAEELPTQVYNKLSELRTMNMDTLASLRRFAQELRPVILDDLGLPASLEWMADNLMRENSMIDASVSFDMGRRRLTRSLQLHLFRITQEVLRNISKYAEASKVMIKLEITPEEIRLIITDNGKGFKVPAKLSEFVSVGKLGIMGIQERVKLLRGTLSISSHEGQGSTVFVQLPKK